MSSYQTFAGAYDALMADGQYRRRADFLERLFHQSGRKVQTVLDLACGTGTIACLLAERGYEVTATDASEEMLTAAAQKAAALKTGRPPFFLHQTMPRLRLLEPVDAAISTMDSLNYLTGSRALEETFRRVYRALKPGGLFLFDVNSPYKLRRMDGQLYTDETETEYCAWRTAFSERTKICTYQVDLFRLRGDGAWERSFEEHRERAWETEELTAALTAAGFVRVRVSGDLRLTPPGPTEDRLIFRCEKTMEKD